MSKPFIALAAFGTYGLSVLLLQSSNYSETAMYLLAAAGLVSSFSIGLIALQWMQD